MTAANRLIVEVRWSPGPHASRRAILDPGQSLRIGRTDRAELAIPQDHQLSGTHCDETRHERAQGVA